MLTPRPYQIVGRDFLAGRRHALLADQMRVGKTPQAILACQAIDAKRVLVLAPAIAVPQWRSEFSRWWPDAPRPMVMSYQSATDSGVALTSQRWDVVIPDEAHFAKNPEAKRTKLVYGKGGLGWASDRLWPLSGTPAPKHAGELWPMLRAFGVVKMTYDEFLRHFCVVTHTGKIFGTKEKHIPELRALLAPIMLRRTRAEVAPEVPPIEYQFLEVEPATRPDLGMGRLSDDEIADFIDRYPTADADNRIAVALAKVDPLVEQIAFHIENGLYQQTVVFGWHVEPLKTLVGQLGARDIPAALINGETTATARVRIQNQFRAGEIKVVAANILAAGTAIDLSAASHGYFLEIDWVPGNNVQAANRLVSVEKAQPVTFDVLTWRGSVDDAVQRVVMRRVKELAQLY